MGLVNLENKIRENRAFFDAEPSENHLEKFQSKLAQVEVKKIKSGRKRLNANKIFAVAASVTVLLFISLFALLEYPKLNNGPQLSDDLMHVKMYYSAQTSEKMSEIKNCANQSSAQEMLYESTEGRLQKLDNNTQELERKLSLAQGNKQLENAYILSLKAKSEVVNQIYDQMCANNTNNIITQ
ncbi:MAG: hypothetical protein JW857_07870 [Bacteroidales bacterium]|nr:hypothetical protein [Bacteroidales bacterium]